MMVFVSDRRARQKPVQRWLDGPTPAYAYTLMTINNAETDPPIGSHLRTLALKTENFSKKIGRFSKTQKWIY